MQEKFMFMLGCCTALQLHKAGLLCGAHDSLCYYLMLYGKICSDHAVIML